MKLKNKILSLISCCILFTSMGNKKTNSGFLTTIGCIGAFFTIIKFASFLGSIVEKDNKVFRENAKETIKFATFTVGMFGLNYFIDKYIDNKNNTKEVIK